MKRFEQSPYWVVVASTFSVWFALACNAPPPVGDIQSGQPHGAVGSAGGSPSSAGSSGAAGSGGTGGIVAFVVPDASAPGEDVAEDSAPASGDVNCGSVQSKLQKKPADLLLVLDRSLSMGRAMDSSTDCPAGSANCSQRWATIISSLGTVLASSSSDLNWGLKFFSSPAAPVASGTGGRGGRGGGFTTPTAGNCTVSAGVEVPIASGNADKLQTQIRQAGNAGYTPTRLAINAAVAYLKTVNDGNNKFILLATDGEPNCGGDTESIDSDLDATLTAVGDAAAAGYKVFVIGVGTETGNLTEMAQKGGTEKFYAATTPEDLSAALSTIVGFVGAGCTYELPSVPATPDAVGVYVDKSLIPQSDSEGWSYAAGSSSTININGSYCDDLKSGEKSEVQIFLPCKPSDPIPTMIF
jgi:hypothetical protein